MRYKALVLALIVLAATAYAKETKAYQSGKLLEMDSVQCGMEEKDGKSLASDLVGTDAGHKKTHELLCQEYVVQTEQVVYRVRPKDDKHPALLPIGQNAQFRFQKDKMLLRVEGLDNNKEREYVVVSIKPRGESTADASPARLNHLQ